VAEQSNQREFEIIVKGALLHDIGKVIQRASDNPTDKRHTEWGYNWLKDNLDDDVAANAALYHHYIDDTVFKTNMGLIWYQADNLASAERKGIEIEKLEEGKWHSEIAIASPFSRIRNPNNTDEKPPLTFLPLKKIDDGIPQALDKEPRIKKKNYKNLWREFEEDFHDSEIPKPHSIDFLLMLFEKYFSRVPSITMRIYGGIKKEEIRDKHPDISLYDHSKLTAAIAGCMYHYYRETYSDRWNKKEPLKEEILNVPPDVKPYLLIGGDISGVQKFIYTITSKGALKSLKGRSFFLELLSEHFVSELINGLNLTRCNLIFSGGGHFYILAYNTPSAKETIERLKKRFDEYLFKEFKGELQLHLEFIEFHPDGFKDASGIWGGLSEKLERSKKKKWQDKLNEVLEVETQHKDCLTDSCNICFREDIPLVDLENEGETLKVCEPCKSQYALGKSLLKISKKDFLFPYFCNLLLYELLRLLRGYPVLYKLAKKPEGNFIKIEDIYYQLKTGWDKELHKDALAVYRINDFTAKHYSHPHSIYLPLGLYQHENLEELVDASTIFGIKRIGVLRMDVDNLGKIFLQAVPEEDRTFSRMASISRGLNNFFKYYLNDIVKGVDIENTTDIAGRDIEETNGRMLSIVYSGGDDLFIIGNWLDVTEVSFDINRYFRMYTGNPFMTISGGIAVNHEKYPVYQYARDAGDAEDRAKKDKNSITLFGTDVFNWDDAEKVIKRVKFFCNFLKLNGDSLTIKDDKITMTFFYRLFEFSRRFKDEGVLILPRVAYLLSKIDRENKIEEVVMKYEEKEWEITKTATMWTLMMLRKGGDEDENV
jgi:CRISPR-associated protein Csm1